jgi:hypothetical protein
VRKPTLEEDRDNLAPAEEQAGTPRAVSKKMSETIQLADLLSTEADIIVHHVSPA